MYRKTYVKISNKVLTENVQEIIKKYSNYKYYIGVVKGNAYGHGDYIVNDLIKGGVNYLAVSSLEEAISVRKNNREIPILVLEPIPLDYLKEIAENNITITIESISYVQELLSKTLTKNLNVHLKLDTGMHRLGIQTKEEVTESIHLLSNNKMINVEGIYTHLATSGINDAFYDKQIAKFKELVSDIDLTKIEIIHLGRSITLVHHPKEPFETGIRLGICMYGFNQSINNPTGIRKIKRDMLVKKLGISESILSNDLKLNTAFSLYTEVMSIKKVHPGEFVGYGANYLAKEDMLVATLPIGYFDGMKKEMKYVSINNSLYEIVGDICMDMTSIKVDKNIHIHDKVEIFGNHISIKDVSLRTNSNAYHVLTSITTRVPRIYDDSKEIKY